MATSTATFDGYRVTEDNLYYRVTQDGSTRAYSVETPMATPYIGQKITYYIARGMPLANVTTQISYAGTITNVWPDGAVDITTYSINGKVPFLVRRLPYFDASSTDTPPGMGGYATDVTNPAAFPPPAPTLQPIYATMWPETTTPAANPADSDIAFVPVRSV